ncbi:hypothetical protein CYLTODRAFT_425937 [Cylindrobasidium torrendii FP15055 ss-10]|uniref:F-box domain-containing protein n=1 Tax=Cylindrobasidium torrendii FP15055 ss-10 TaxID=1314674 RepID=A0A0D7B090_9AGAR|nr:hypothetical protein CYLTODRAFT_425937 [Cylindrobasidium torrendii FP15055 ss-10]
MPTPKLYLDPPLRSFIAELPDELLQEIFRYFRPSTTTTAPETPIRVRVVCKETLNTTSLSTPWLLSYVCQRWRNIAISHSVLWSWLILDFAEYDKQKSKIHVLYRLALHLERSGTQQLSVSIVDRRDDIRHDTTCPSFQAMYVFPMLKPTTTRWRVLELDGGVAMAIWFQNSKFDQLRALTLFLHGFEPEADAKMTTFKDAPNLRRLDLLGMYPMEMPWSTIRTYVTTQGGVSLLRHMENLTVLDLTGCAADPVALANAFMDFHDFAPVTLPNVVKLILAEYKYKVPSGFNKALTQNLRMPSLREVCLILSAGDVSVPVFMHDSAAGVTYVMIEMWHDMEKQQCDDIIEMLKGMSKIEELNFTKAANPAILEALKASACGDILVPNLNYLTVNSETMVNNGSLMYDMVVSRDLAAEKSKPKDDPARLSARCKILQDVFFLDGPHGWWEDDDRVDPVFVDKWNLLIYGDEDEDERGEVNESDPKQLDV